MNTVKMELIDKYSNRKIKVRDEVGDGWVEQVEVFFNFLLAQGFVITYSSFLDSFGDSLKAYQEAMEE